jgi:hypothetical protein
LQDFKGRVAARVDNDNHFAPFFAKKGLEKIIAFREKNYVIIAIIIIVRNSILAIIAERLSVYLSI